jgi:hypothetical protein
VLYIYKENTGFSRHFPNVGHSYGKVEDAMAILKEEKGLCKQSRKLLQTKNNQSKPPIK